MNATPHPPTPHPQMLFDKYIDANAVVTGLQKSRPTRVTPKMFQHTMKVWEGVGGGYILDQFRKW